MINPYQYESEEILHDTYDTAKERKKVLKSEGFRVKIIKNADGKFEIWKKNVTAISIQRDMQKGRVRKWIKANER